MLRYFFLTVFSVLLLMGCNNGLTGQSVGKGSDNVRVTADDMVSDKKTALNTGADVSRLESNEWYRTNKWYRLECENCDLSYANLSNADLRYANLNGANLTGADLSGSLLCNAQFKDAILDYADVNGAIVSGELGSAVSMVGVDLLTIGYVC